MQIQLRQIEVPPGQQVLLKNVSWQMLEDILAELGESRAARISYSHGILEIMTPLAEHEDSKIIIGNLVEILLEELDLEFRNLGSTTFKNAQMLEAVEADACFYIQNEIAIRGKSRINLETDPPPDLAIEIDITSRTRFNNYQILGVPELWRYNGKELEMNVLADGKYLPSNLSPTFPQFPLITIIPQFLKQSKTSGRNATIKAFRNWVKEELSN
jgi:Uma2 family endonuclease